MNDAQIVELYFAREEAAIAESRNKYGAYCTKIAWNILRDDLDCEECVNDTWFRAWRSIPPHKPSNLATYLGKITRNLSINLYHQKYADKRRSNVYTVSLEELNDCIPEGESVESNVQAACIGESINRFLHAQKPLERRAFVCRYYYCESITEIAERFSISESRVKSLLFRMRAKLRLHLEQDGIAL